MNFREYQAATTTTAIYPNPGSGDWDAITYAVLGLASEAGEVAGKLKKALRDDGGAITSTRRAAIIDELGDVLWYVARVASEFAIDLDQIARRNIAKLGSRATRDVLGGDGDQR